MFALRQDGADTASGSSLAFSLPFATYRGPNTSRQRMPKLGWVPTLSEFVEALSKLGVNTLALQAGCDVFKGADASTQLPEPTRTSEFESYV